MRTILVFFVILFSLDFVFSGCSIRSASWGQSVVNESDSVDLLVTPRGNCVGYFFEYSIYEHDPGFLAPDDFITTFSADSSVTPSWVSTYDSEGGQEISPEYYFTASVVSGVSIVQSSDPKLSVIKEPVSLDVDNSGELDIKDLALITFNQGSANGKNHLDLNSDGIIDFNDLLIVMNSLKN